MDYFSLFTLITEIIGTISFSISGAMTAIKKEMDLFGVIILGLTTAVGGGVIRDLTLGNHPPKTFLTPIYGIVAIGAAILTFVVVALRRHPKAGHDPLHLQQSAELLMFWMDTIGLAIFTVVGISTAYETAVELGKEAYSPWLLVFVGVITGVGGGVVRDLFAGNTPYIFVKHIYACACILGSLVCVALWNLLDRIPAMLAGAFVVLILRYLARRFKWNLPRIRSHIE